MWKLRTLPPDPEHPLTFRLLPGHLRTIGRSAGATFVVDVPLISRVHCRLTVADDGSVEVTDLDSTNGTWIDGEKIATAPLAEGQVLRVGRVEFVLERDEPATQDGDEAGPGNADTSG
jgi:pSer/pThr/pTyr-binding forkhead associated (FHA) protein